MLGLLEGTPEGGVACGSAGGRGGGGGGVVVRGAA